MLSEGLDAFLKKVFASPDLFTLQDFLDDTNDAYLSAEDGTPGVRGTASGRPFNAPGQPAGNAGLRFMERLRGNKTGRDTAKPPRSAARLPVGAAAAADGAGTAGDPSGWSGAEADVEYRIASERLRLNRRSKEAAALHCVAGVYGAAKSPHQRGCNTAAQREQLPRTTAVTVRTRVLPGDWAAGQYDSLSLASDWQLHGQSSIAGADVLTRMVDELDLWAQAIRQQRHWPPPFGEREAQYLAGRDAAQPASPTSARAPHAVQAAGAGSDRGGEPRGVGQQHQSTTGAARDGVTDVCVRYCSGLPGGNAAAPVPLPDGLRVCVTDGTHLSVSRVLGGARAAPDRWAAPLDSAASSRRSPAGETIVQTEEIVSFTAPPGASITCVCTGPCGATPGSDNTLNVLPVLAVGTTGEAVKASSAGRAASSQTSAPGELPVGSLPMLEDHLHAAKSEAATTFDHSRPNALLPTLSLYAVLPAGLVCLMQLHACCAVTAMCFSPEGSYVITGGKDGVCRVWSAWRRGQLAPISEHNCEAPDKVSGGDGAGVRSGGCDAAPVTVLSAFYVSGAAPPSLQHQLPPLLVAAGTSNGGVCVFDALTGSRLWRSQAMSSQSADGAAPTAHSVGASFSGVPASRLPGRATGAARDNTVASFYRTEVGDGLPRGDPQPLPPDAVRSLSFSSGESDGLLSPVLLAVSAQKALVFSARQGEILQTVLPQASAWQRRGNDVDLSAKHVRKAARASSPLPPNKVMRQGSISFQSHRAERKYPVARDSPRKTALDSSSARWERSPSSALDLSVESRNWSDDDGSSDSCVDSGSPACAATFTHGAFFPHAPPDAGRAHSAVNALSFLFLSDGGSVLSVLTPSDAAAARQRTRRSSPAVSPLEGQLAVPSPRSFSPTKAARNRRASMRFQHGHQVSPTKYHEPDLHDRASTNYDAGAGSSSGANGAGSGRSPSPQCTGVKNTEVVWASRLRAPVHTAVVLPATQESRTPVLVCRDSCDNTLLITLSAPWQ